MADNKLQGEILDKRVACGVCAAPLDRVFLTAPAPDADGARRYTLFKCAGCGNTQLFPLPAAAESQDLYFKEYYGAAANSAQGLLKNLLMGVFMGQRVRAVTRGLPKGAAVLDYGCGNGDFVFAMRRAGYDCRGYDPNSPSDSEFINKDHGGRAYDLITLWHVFEHFNEPAAELLKIAALLKPGGKIFLAVPNFASLDARAGGEKWFHLDLPRHVFHYSPAGLDYLVRKTGLRVVKSATPCNWYAVFGMWQTMFNLSGCAMNVLYYTLKRGGRITRGQSVAVAFKDLLLHVVLGLPYFILSFVLTFVISLFNRSGALEIICEKPRDAAHNTAV